jgi:hypothetical protein
MTTKDQLDIWIDQALVIVAKEVKEEMREK